MAEFEKQITEATAAASASTVIKGPSPASAALPDSPAAAVAEREVVIQGTAPKTVAPALDSAPVEEQVAPGVVIDRELDHLLATAARAKSVLTPCQSPPRSRPAFEPVSRQSPGAAPGSSRRGAQPNVGSPAALRWNRMFGQLHVDGFPLSKYDQLSPLTYVWLEQPCQSATLTQLRDLSRKPAEVRRMLLYSVKEPIRASVAMSEMLRPPRYVMTGSITCEGAFLRAPNEASYVEMV